MRLTPVFHLARLAPIVLLVAQLRGQAPADRRFLDSLATTLARASTTSELPPPPRCAERSGDVARLCSGLLLARTGDLTDDRNKLLAARELLERSASDHDDWPWAWYALGALRLDAVRFGILARPGPGQIAGVSNQVASTANFAHALALDASFVRAAEGIASAPLTATRNDAAALAVRRELLRQFPDQLSPAVHFSIAHFELDAGSADSAVALLKALLRTPATGLPEGRVTLTLARACFKIGRIAEGRALYFAGAKDTSQSTQAAYREQIGWIATPAELGAWDSLPAAQHAAWLSFFFAGRDVSDGRPEGARLEEHLRRLNFAYEHYRLILPSSGRHLLSQNQEDVQKSMIPFLDGSVNGDMDQHITDFLLEQSLGAASPLRTISITQQTLDDRGLVYVRHGAPSSTAVNPPGEAGEVATAAWRYDLPEGPLLLQFIEEDFDGSIEATRLVPTLAIGHTGALDRFCKDDFAYCHQSKPSIATMARLRAAGLEQIKRALTTDAFRQKMTSAMHPSVAIHGLRRVDHQMDVVVVPFAIPGDEVTPAFIRPSDQKPFYLVPLHLMAARHQDGKRFDLDTTLLLPAARQLGVGEYLVGMLELPVGAGAFAVSLTFGKNDSLAAIARIDPVVTPADGHALTVSDMVIGRASSGVAWNSGAMRVPLNPLNVFPVNGEAEVYFQLSGLVPGTSYATSFALNQANDKPNRPPRLALTFSQSASQERLEMTRSLSLKNLEPGHYRVRLTVSGGGRTTTTMGWLTIK